MQSRDQVGHTVGSTAFRQTFTSTRCHPQDAIAEAVGRFCLSQQAPKFLARDMTSDRDMRLSRARRTILRECPQIPGVPCLAKRWRKRIAFARHDFKRTAK